MNYEKCSSCEKRNQTVRQRNCGYHSDVNNNPNYLEIVCDSCEEQHVLDI